jgi:hypothetical protein
MTYGTYSLRLFVVTYCAKHRCLLIKSRCICTSSCHWMAALRRKQAFTVQCHLRTCRHRRCDVTCMATSRSCCGSATEREYNLRLYQSKISLHSRLLHDIVSTSCLHAVKSRVIYDDRSFHLNRFRYAACKNASICLAAAIDQCLRQVEAVFFNDSVATGLTTAETY